MIVIPTQVVIDAIEDGSVLVTRRAEIYESDGETLWSPEGPGVQPLSRLLQGGSVSLDYTREERRIFDLSLDNFDNKLRPHAGGLWYDKVVKIFRGLEIAGVNQEWQLGEFLIDGISADNFPYVVKIQGRDYTKRMMLSKLSESISFDASYKIHDVIRSLAANSGITKLGRLPNDSPEIGTKYDVEQGKSRWEVSKDLATGKGYDLFFDNEGYLRLESFSDPALSPIEWTFKTGLQGNLVSYSRSVADSDLYNIVVVVGATPEDGTLPPYYRAENNEPSSPTSIAKLGERMMPPITLESAASVADCRVAARKMLKIAGLESFELQFSSILYPFLDVGIVVSIFEPDRLEGDPSRFLLTEMNFPLDLGPSSATGRRVTIVGQVGDSEDPAPDVPVDPGPPDPEVDPPNPVEPDPDPVGITQDIRIASYNTNAGALRPAQVINSLEKIAASADFIGIQEAGSATDTLTKFLDRNRGWGIWRGKGDPQQSVAWLYRKNLGTVTGKKAYLAVKRQFVGNRGSSPTVNDKYVMRLDFKLSATLRTVQLFNTQMLPSASRSRAFLGADEYQRRRAHYTKHLGVLVSKIDASNGLVFGTGDYSATSDFTLLSPLWTELGGVANLDHNYNTQSGARTDYVYHRTHNAITVVSSALITGLSSDHDCPVVTYRVKKAP